MSIEERWSEKDRKVFLDGLARYASTGARSVYCETTGLTDDWITNSTVPLLATALRNIGVDRLTKDRKPMQRNQMAMLLRAFVRGHALKTTGQQDEAVASYRAAIAAKPDPRASPAARCGMPESGAGSCARRREGRRATRMGVWECGSMDMARECVEVVGA